MSRTGTDSFLKVDPLLLGIGSAFAGFLVIVQNDSPLVALLGHSDASFMVKGWLVGICAFALGAAILYRIRRGTGALPLGFLAPMSTLLFVLGALLIWLTRPEASPDAVLLFGGGFLIGLSGAGLINAWGAVYATLRPERALFHAALALALCSFAYPLAGLPLLQHNPLVYACSLVLISAFPFMRLHARLPAPASPEDHFSGSTRTGDRHPQPSRHGNERESDLSASIGPSLVRTLWKPLLSAALATFLIGLVWDPFAASLSSSQISLERLWMLVLAPNLTVAAVIIALRLAARSFTLHIFCDLVMPVAIVVLLIVPLIAPLIAVETSYLEFIQGFLSQMCFAAITLAVWTALTTGARTTGLSIQGIVSGGCILLALAQLIGMLAITFIGTGGRLVCLVLFTLFLVLIIVDFALHDRSQNINRELMRNTIERYLATRCDALALRCNLSAREREVLGYLARGYSHVYIAKELYVSENTVRTHVKHIYTKLKVSSREAIIQLIDSE